MVYRRVIWFCLLVLLPTAMWSQHRDTLEVAVYDRAPFAYFEQSGRPDGLMIMLWEQIAQRSDLAYRYHPTSLTELLNGMDRGTYDIGVGALEVTPDREALVDFTHAIFPSAIGIATRPLNTWRAYIEKWKPIIGDIFGIILALILMLVISAAAVLIVERRHSRTVKSNRSIKSLSDGVWWSAVTMTTVGYGDKVPHSRYGKAVGILWIFLSVLLFTLFTANTSAKLTNQVQPGVIGKDTDLYGARVGVVDNSAGQYYASDHRITHTNYPDIHAALDALADEELDAVIHNIHIMRHDCVAHGLEDILIIDKPLKTNYMGMTIANDCEWREQINGILLDILYAPQWERMMSLYLGSSSAQ